MNSPSLVGFSNETFGWKTENNDETTNPWWWGNDFGEFHDIEGAVVSCRGRTNKKKHAVLRWRFFFGASGGFCWMKQMGFNVMVLEWVWTRRDWTFFWFQHLGSHIISPKSRTPRFHSFVLRRFEQTSTYHINTPTCKRETIFFLKNPWDDFFLRRILQKAEPSHKVVWSFSSKLRSFILSFTSTFVFEFPPKTYLYHLKKHLTKSHHLPNQSLKISSKNLPSEPVCPL